MKDNRALFKNGFSNAENVFYLTDAQVKKMQRITLSIFKDFLRVADKYHLNYCMGGGSALGAVRHHGFIPWDDDIDVNIPRKDYNQFLEVFDRELGQDYELCAPERENLHGLACTQMKKKGAIYRSFEELSKPHPGIGIDFFVIENVYNSPVRRKTEGYLSLAMGYLLTCRKTYHEMPYLRKYIENVPSLRKAFEKKARFGRMISWISLDRAAELVAKQYSKCKDEHSKYVTVPSGRKHYFGEMYPRPYLCETVFMPFEDIQVRVAKEYDAYLSHLYGSDYMKIPPEGRHEQHPIMELDFGDSI